MHVIRVRRKSLDKFKARVRQVTRRQQGRNVDAALNDLNPVIRGWARYFGVGNVQRLFTKLDKAFLHMRRKEPTIATSLSSPGASLQAMCSLLWCT